MKSVFKIEVTPARNGYIIEAHSDSKGKAVTETFVCESAASVMRRLPPLLQKLGVPSDGEAPFG